MRSCSVEEFKASLASMGRTGLALDIDETLAATNVAWFERCIHLFGNPEGLSVQQLVAKYHYAQNNPAWQSDAAKDWMHQQREAPEAQDGLPLIEGAIQGVQQLQKELDGIFVGYLTVRPQKVNANTLQWLQECGFPDLPLLAKPNDIPYEQGNQWKAQALHSLYPNVTGIVDDNPQVPTFAGPHYQGTIFLFGRDKVQDAYRWAIPLPYVANSGVNSQGRGFR
jgi:hypothetical protein